MEIADHDCSPNGSERLDDLCLPRSERPKLPKNSLIANLSAAVGFGLPASLEEIRREQLQQPTLQQVIRRIPEGRPPLRDNWKTSPVLKRYCQIWHQLEVKDGLLYRKKRSPAPARDEQWLLVLPDSLVQTVLEQIHDRHGHLGTTKTLETTEKRSWWPGYAKCIQEWIQRCKSCAERKAPGHKLKAPLYSIPVGGPMEMLAMDFLGPLPETTRGNRYILVISDYFTKWVDAIAVTNQAADTVAQVLYAEVTCRYGVPLVLHSDQSRSFEARVIYEICQLLGLKKVRTTAYNPQCDGIVERFNRTLLDVLSHYVSETKETETNGYPRCSWATGPQSTAQQERHRTASCWDRHR